MKNEIEPMSSEEAAFVKAVLKRYESGDNVGRLAIIAAIAIMRREQKRLSEDEPREIDLAAELHPRWDLLNPKETKQ